MKFEIRVNGVAAEFVHPLKTGDTLEIILSTPEDGEVSSTSARTGLLNGLNLPPELMPIEEKTPARFKNITIADLTRND